eukprot:jgi/Undpi1/5771/HiC_scaffold_2.g01045.m1
MNDSAGKLRSSWRQLRCEPALPGVANRSAARTPLGTSLQRLDQARSAKGVPAADGNRFTHQAQADATLEQASRKDVGTRSLLLLLVHTPPRLLGSDPSSHRLAWRVVALDDAMLRQRSGKEGASASAAEPPLPMDSDEQERVLATIAQEARSQTALFAGIFSGFLLVCALALIYCFLHLMFRGDVEPLAHRALLKSVPDVAFHATYAGQLLGLFLAFKAAQNAEEIFGLGHRDATPSYREPSKASVVLDCPWTACRMYGDVK